MLQKTSITTRDGIFVNPVIGKKKSGDFVDEVIVTINDAKLSVYLNHFSNYAEINYLKKDTPDFFEKIVKPLSEKFEIQSAIFKKSKAEIEETTLEKTRLYN